MVYSSYDNTSYLPLDNDQGVSFYKNENLLFPQTVAVVSPASTLGCRRNTAAMLTTTSGSSPFGSQPLHHGSQHGGNVCDDFQPVAHLSSNGYYGYVPASSIPKMMSTEGTPTANGNGVGVPLVCHPVATSTVDSNSPSMMDCGGGGGGIGEVEEYHHHQQRKRKEFSQEVDVNCKRRKTWLQPNDAGFMNTSNWSQSPVLQMDCHDQPMDTFSTQHFNGSPVIMNAATTTFNGFHVQQQALMTSQSIPTTPQPQATQYPTNRLIGACSPLPMPVLLESAELAEKQTHRQSHTKRFGDSCQEVEDLFISLHGSGFYLTC